METRERPILFSAPMVRAILAGEKTVTRRTVKWPLLGPSDGRKRRMYCPSDVAVINEAPRKLCPYGGAGDRLWVRETWRPEERLEDGRDGIRFAADDAFVSIKNTREAANAWVETHRFHMGRPIREMRWRPSIHIPRWASRITLEVVSVRVERLCSLDDSEAIREGIPAAGDVRPFARFAELWDAINGDRAPWASDPWVWRVEFKRAEVTL